MQFLKLFMFFVLGIVLNISKVTLDTWQFWVIISLVIGIETIAEQTGKAKAESEPSES